MVQGKPKELKVAVQAQPPPSAPIRLMCSARLISLIDSATKAAAVRALNPLDNTAALKSKKRKASDLAEPAEAAEAPAKPAAADSVLARAESPFLADAIAFVSKLQATSGVALAAELSEDVDEALSKLRQCEAVVAAKLAGAPAGKQAGPVHNSSQ